MWDHYRKNFLGTQIFILAVAALVFFKLGRNVLMAATFVATMEAGALVGAAWASRLKRILRSR